jgi:hypothetical protein
VEVKEYSGFHIVELGAAVRRDAQETSAKRAECVAVDRSRAHGCDNFDQQTYGRRRVPIISSGCWRQVLPSGTFGKILMQDEKRAGSRPPLRFVV